METIIVKAGSQLNRLCSSAARSCLGFLCVRAVLVVPTVVELIVSSYFRACTYRLRRTTVCIGAQLRPTPCLVQLGSRKT